jgi:nicotinamidase-related amidase
MALIRKGSKPALVIVDAQVAVMQPTWEPDRIIDNIHRAVEKAREQGIPVIWVQHSDDELVKDSPGWDLEPELIPEPGEIRMDKHYNSAFEETTLEETLAELDVSQIVLCGAATNWCIRATAYAALDRGYDLTLISDAHTTEDTHLGDADIIAAQDIILDLNNVMTWTSYPTRTNRVVSVNELGF